MKMNRLQKKCLIATAGFHLLLVLTLVFGSAFFTARPRPQDTHVLDVIPANIVEAAFNSGVKNAQRPAAQPAPQIPIVQPPAPLPKPQPRPEPPQPKPQPKPEPPAPKPEPVKHSEPKPDKAPQPEPKPEVTKTPQPEPKPAPKPEPHKIVPNLHRVTRHASADAAAKRAAQAAREEKARLKAIAAAASSIKANASSSTEVEMPGVSSESYANFKDALASLYYNAWTPPDNPANDSAITKVRIVIARDGKVISAKVIGPSGDAQVDASVRRAIDRVSSVPPLPGGESQRTVILNFNLKTKRMIG